MSKYRYLIKKSISKSNFFSPSTMNKILDPHNREKRIKLKNVFKNQIFKPKYNLSLNEERDVAYQRLKKICDARVVSVKDFWNNPTNIFSTHEITGMCDGSLCTKLTVQFNLFGGTVLKLGTQKHHYLLDKIDSLEAVGCFGLTELGYGNNAVEMETTAHYDNNTKKFIINTPSIKAQKYWITNGAIHAHYSVVFARLIKDNIDEGIHGFLVPIRDNNLVTKENVTIWDMGYKIGLNGIDNAALWFNNVEVDKDSLLDTTSQINSDNEFQSEIVDNSKRKRKRFIKLADQLLSGRVCIASMCLGSTKVTLNTTIKYAHSRLTVGEKGLSDTPIMNYQLQINEIMPLIAKTYAYNFLLNYIQERYANQTDEDYNEVLKLCCIIKPMISWHAENTATTCRERCGGQGFLSANRFGEAIFGSHAGITAEGDNRVIQQKVAKELLDEVCKKKVLKNILIRKLPNKIKYFIYRVNNTGSYLNREWFLNLFRLREEILLSELAYKMNKSKKNIFNTWMYKESDLIQETAKAYGDRLAIEEFFKTINNLDEQNDELLIILNELYFVYVLSEVKNNIGFFMGENIITSNQYKVIKDLLNHYNYNISYVSDELVDSFDIPKWMNYAPISNNWERYNDHENNGEIINDYYKD
jgi:acyl-CoA oxidase